MSTCAHSTQRMLQDPVLDLVALLYMLLVVRGWALVSSQNFLYFDCMVEL